MSKRIRLWDLPTRIFHWLLVLATIAAVVSGEIGGKLMEWHGRIGIFIAGLIAFRLVWGIVGSTYARFGQFFPSPAAIKRYLAGNWQGLGHNPLGALSVFALLTFLTLQTLTGLFANDDIAFYGPLYNLIDASLSGKLTGVHEAVSNLLIALVALHVAAIVFYVRKKKDNLVHPMITGWKEVEEGESAKGGGLAALIVALAIAAAAIYGASGAWVPAPPPAPAVTTPSW